MTSFLGRICCCGKAESADANANGKRDDKKQKGRLDGRSVTANTALPIAGSSGQAETATPLTVSTSNIASARAVDDQGSERDGKLKGRVGVVPVGFDLVASPAKTYVAALSPLDSALVASPQRNQNDNLKPEITALVASPPWKGGKYAGSAIVASPARENLHLTTGMPLVASPGKEYTEQKGSLVASKPIMLYVKNNHRRHNSN